MTSLLAACVVLAVGWAVFCKLLGVSLRDETPNREDVRNRINKLRW